MGRPTMKPSITSLDLRQLRILYLLLTQRSVSGVATELGITQPAVSLTLARLREIFGDPLLVRSGSEMIPSDRAAAMIGTISTLIDGYDQLFALDREFDPALSARRFRIASPNYFSAYVLPGLAVRLATEASNLRLDAMTMVPGRDYESALADGEIDLLIGNWPDPPGYLRTAHLLDDELVCIVGRGHPLASQDAVDMDTYRALSHISPSSARDARFSPVDGQLAKMRIRRRIQMVLPDYHLIPQVVAQTRLVLTTGAGFAPIAQRSADIVILRAPEEFDRIQLRLLWHERSHHDTAHRWVRALLREIIASL